MKINAAACRNPCLRLNIRPENQASKMNMGVSNGRWGELMGHVGGNTVIRNNPLVVSIMCTNGHTFHNTEHLVICLTESQHDGSLGHQ